MKRTRKAARRAVSRRPKRARREYFDAKRNLTDPILRAKWDNRKSPAVNLSRFKIQEFQHLLADDEELKQRSPEKKLNEMETKIISRLVEKHKDDYTKMSRDLKLNVYQWTYTQCRRLSLCFSRGHCCTVTKTHMPHLVRNQQQQQQEQQQQQQQEQQQQTAAAAKKGKGRKAA